MTRFILLILMAWILIPAQVWAAAVHDGEADVSGNVSAGTSLTITGKTTAGTNRVGIVQCAWNNNTPTITGFTWNGAAMTQVVAGTESVGVGLGAAIWRIVAPPTAASNVVGTFSSSATGYCVASSYNGADQTTPISASNTFNTTGVASPATITCPTAADETVVDAVSWTQFDITPPTIGAGQSNILNQLYGSFYFALASRQLGSVDGVMSWIFSGVGHWVNTCVSIKAAATSGQTFGFYQRRNQ